jgi:toxin YoeB
LPSRKKRSNKDEQLGTEVKVEIVTRVPVFEPEFRDDLGWWYKNDPQKASKILDIVQDVLQDPFKGVGKPEPLKYLDSDTWSRRIDLEHRVVYRVGRDRINFLQARYHYSS